MEIQNLSFSGFLNVDCILFGGHRITKIKTNLIDEGRITFMPHVYLEVTIPGL
jgi:hypothetical protein